MIVQPSSVAGVLVIEPEVHRDDRGSLLEAFDQRVLAARGVELAFVQDNLSRSRRGVLRGLHYQLGEGSGPGQAKVVRAVSGRILDVVADLRQGSPTFACWAAVELSADNRRSVFIPPGVAHGFYALSTADVLYKLSSHYCPELERGVIWCDPALGIEWPTGAPLLSPRDAALPRLAEVSERDQPPFVAAGEG